jgi:pyruvate/2-oxoglutarate dehydrogenase complex dihydrolipoamide acyltransferase (E2) component
VYEFKMPALGAEMTHGKLIEWKIKVGDDVKRHDIIAVIDTDKAAIDTESYGEGIVEKLLINPGEDVPVGTVMALIRGEKEDVSELIKGTTKRAKISPRARKKAAQLGIDISQIAATTDDGVISVENIERFAIKQKASQTPKKSMQTIIAKAMEKSKQEIPHYYLSLEMDLTKALKWLEEFNRNHKITERILYAVLLIKATANVLKLFPEFNGYYQNNEFRPHQEINIGMAISLRGGRLIAPALLNCEQKGVTEIMQDLNDLVARARAGKLRDRELSSATITLTNLGEFGVDSVFGIIYPPQVALLGFGKLNGNTLTTTLSADHRVTNGIYGSRFLTTINNLLQEVEKL